MNAEMKDKLLDISYAVTEIERFFDETPKDFEVYHNEPSEIKRSVETHIETIADALKDIFQMQPNIQLSNAQKIIETEDKIIYDHNSVSDEMIWSIIINYLETLKAEVQQILQQ